MLPGEVVTRCVEGMDAGTLDPVELLKVEQLIVDEVQDLNPVELRFVHGMAARGARLFAAGDDDQSRYAFRHALRKGSSGSQKSELAAAITPCTIASVAHPRC